MKASSPVFHTSLSSASCFQCMSPCSLVSSSDLQLCLPLPRACDLGLQSVIPLVRSLSCLPATCPVHLCFWFIISLIIHWTSVLSVLVQLNAEGVSSRHTQRVQVLVECVCACVRACVRAFERACVSFIEQMNNLVNIFNEVSELINVSESASQPPTHPASRSFSQSFSRFIPIHPIFCLLAIHVKCCKTFVYCFILLAVKVQARPRPTIIF